MNVLKISIGIFLALAASRFVPHPPNFTSLIALSFYIPVLFGIKFLPILLLSFIITDLIIGFHGVTLFTWGTVILIGLMAKFFVSNITTRISAALLGACLFYLITNFGVWSLGSYGYSLDETTGGATGEVRRRRGSSGTRRRRRRRRTRREDGDEGERRGGR